MNYLKHSLSLLAAGVCVTAPIGISAVFAADSSVTEISEIVVTARQRSEKISDVPASLQAFTAADIKDAGIQRPNDFIALTPGLSIVNTGEVGDMQVNIRGINTSRDAETNFGLIIDGVLLTNRTAFNQEFADIEQIEVLKGPQSAVYGRNASAGAIIITTPKPSNEYVANVKVGLGNNKSVRASGYVSGPLADNLFARIGAYTYRTDGFYTNRYLDTKNVDNLTETGGEARLIWRMSDKNSLDFKARYSKVEAAAISFNAAFAFPNLAGYFGNPDLNQNVNNHPFDYINNIRPENQQRNINLSVKGDFDVGFATLTGVLSHNDQDNYLLADGTSGAFNIYAAEPHCIASRAAQPAAPLTSPFAYGGFTPPYGADTCDGYQYQVRNQRDTSLELRLTSPGDLPIRWIAGVYGLDIRRHALVEQGADLGQPILLQAYNPPGSQSPTDLLYDDNYKSKVIAGFGQLAFDIPGHIELDLALRYDSEKREVANNVPRAIAPFLQTCSLAPNCYINPYYNANPTATSIPNREQTYGQLQPKLSVNWKATEQFSAYASYGYGFRSGGFNSLGSAATIQTFYVANGLNSVQNVQDDYKKEVAKAAEIGFKSNFFDRRVTVNAAIFHTKVDNMQFFEFFAGPFGLLRVVTNIDKVTLKGAEIDAKFRATEWLTLSAGAAVTKGRIDENSNRPYTVGNEVPYAPKATGNVTAELKLPLGGSGWNYGARVEGTYTGKTWFHTVQNNTITPTLFTPFAAFFGLPGDAFNGNFNNTERDAFTLLNGRIGFSNENWSIAAYGRNLTNKHYLAEVIPAPEFGGSFIHDAPGRSYGVEAAYSFK